MFSHQSDYLEIKYMKKLKKLILNGKLPKFERFEFPKEPKKENMLIDEFKYEDPCIGFIYRAEMRNYRIFWGTETKLMSSPDYLYFQMDKPVLQDW